MYIPYNVGLTQFARKLRKSQTKAESILWKEIRGRKILGYKFLRQKPLLNYIVDFYCSELRLAIEIDGSTHYGNSVDKDRIRTNELKVAGIFVRRYTNDEVENHLSEVIENLIAYIRVYEKIRGIAEVD